MAKKLILFDLDGTLTDSGPGITASVASALEELRLPAQSDAELRRFVGPPLAASFEEFCGLSGDDVTRAIAVFRKYYFAGGVFNNAVYPGIPALLAELKAAGARLAVATSKSAKGAEQILAHFGLLPLLDFFVADDGRFGDGEKALIIAEALRVAGCAPEEAVMVGDRKYDVEGAAACGVDALAVGYGYAPPGELESSGAKYFAATVEEARAVLRGLL